MSPTAILRLFLVVLPSAVFVVLQVDFFSGIDGKRRRIAVGFDFRIEQVGLKLRLRSFLIFRVVFLSSASLRLRNSVKRFLHRFCVASLYDAEKRRGRRKTRRQPRSTFATPEGVGRRAAASSTIPSRGVVRQPRGRSTALIMRIDAGDPRISLREQAPTTTANDDSATPETSRPRSSIVNDPVARL